MARKHEPAVASDIAIPSTTTAAELAYLQSRNAVDMLAKDEQARKLRSQLLLLRNQIDSLNEKLWEEQDRAEDAEADVETWQSRAHVVAIDLDRATGNLRSKTAELETIKAELHSLQTVSAGSSKILTQKLALERELANVKPELDHLRSTTTSNQGLLAEKLALSRQLGTAQVELENAQQALQLARSREGKTYHEHAEHDAEVSDLQRKLATAQRELARTDKRAQSEDAKRIKDLEKQLAKEIRERENAESLASSSSTTSDAAESFDAELVAGREARSKLEKDLKKAQQAWDADKAVLEDKLNQFRTKLRSTKEKLKETESELAEARTQLVAKSSANNIRKRSAHQLDPDAAIGTPGDAAKRRKRSTSIFGEKSNFSITPFLNKQSSIIPEDVQEVGNEEPIASIEVTTSPSDTVTKKQRQPLAEASPGKANARIKPVAPKRAAAKISLVSVPEEEEENASLPSAPTAAAEADAPKPGFKKPKLSLKPRKTLDSFASFREASLPPQPVQQKKKRKLGAGAKTLFDEDNEDDDAVAAPSLKSAGALRAFGGLGAGFKRLGALAGKSKGSLMVAEGGFTFSPLKRNPRAVSVQPGA